MTREGTVMVENEAGPTGLSRRLVLRAGLGGAGVLALGGLGVAVSNGSLAAPPVKGASNRLFIPPTAGATTPLTAAPGKIASGGAALLYNGVLPGPNYVVRRGDQVAVPFTNGLDAETTVHWHGLIVPTDADGQPHQPVAPGDSRTYAFEVTQRAGMSWYHPHPHLATASQVAYGLAGGFIIRDAEEDALGLPSGDYEVPLVLRDANVDKAGNLSYNGKASGFSGTIPLANGTRDAELEVDQAWYRFRILIGSNSRLFRLALSSGASFRLIGNDGGLLPQAADLAEMELSPGERVDVLVDCRGISANQTVGLVDGNSGWTLLRLKGTGKAGGTGSTTTVPAAGATLSSGPQFDKESPVTTRLFSFDGMTRINGLVYDMDHNSFDVPAGDLEEWVFRTNGNAPHPIHVHGASFQVIRRDGGRRTLFAWEKGWKDTVLLHDRETVTVRLRFDSGYKGRYLLHCHKLEHEDAGMMLNFTVV